MEEGGLTQAIKKLHLTQSALSHQLKEVEYQLGTPLFYRINKKMVLTQAGEKWYALANEILEKFQETQLHTKKLMQGETGEIRISTECYTSYHWLPSLMKQFHQRYPHVELKIVMEATHQPLQKLLAGELDIAVTSDPIQDPHLAYSELFQDEMLAVVHDGHPWSTKKFVTPEDFQDQHLIIHSLPMETVTVHQFFLEPANIRPKKIIVLPLTEASIEMVKAEMGIMVMSKWALKPYLNHPQLRTIKIGKGGLKRKHYIATLKKKPSPEYFLQFVSFLKNEISLS